jgi:hypothetical protein
VELAHGIVVVTLSEVFYSVLCVMLKDAFAFLCCLVAMALMTQALKDVMQECLLAYLSPREYMVNVEC